jgi:DNA polymerase III gamma/tau subunit
MLSFGQLFGSNFWSSFKAQPSESIERLLAKDGCVLEDLLDDSDLLQECKNSNKNLIKYLNREKIRELIDLITEMPEFDEHNRGHKYPFLANEIFNCDISEVIDRFFISPAEDVVEEEPDEQVIEDDTGKFEPGFEKDNDDSNTDSEDEEIHNEAEGEQNEGEQGETDTKDVTTDGEAKKDTAVVSEDSKADTPEETTSQEGGTGKEELKHQEQPQEEQAKKEDTKQVEENKNESPVAEVENQQDDNKDVAPEDTQNESAVANTENAQDAASPATEETKVASNVQEDNKESEVTPEAHAHVTEALLDNDENEQDSFNDSSTHASEATTEVTHKEEEKEPLSTNKYDLIDYMNRFIDTEDSLNDVLSGYYARLCTILIQKKSDEVALYFFKNENLLYRLAYHSYSKSITDTVIKILDINTDKLDLEESEVARIRKQFVYKLLE